MTKRIFIAVLLLSTVASAQSTKRAGAVPIANFATTCIPKAVTAITLSCSPLFAVDADTVAQAHSTTAQTFLVYGSVDSVASPTNYERARIFDDVPSNVWRLSFEKGGTGTNRGLDFSSGGTYGFTNGVGGSRVFTIVAAGTVGTYGGVAAVAQGLPPIRGTQSLTAQTANLAATNVYASAAAGLYRVCFNAATTTSGTGTTATVGVIWTDAGGVKTFTSATWALNAVDVTGQVNGCQVVRAAASSNIQISVTGTFGTSVYRIDATADQLQ